LYIKSEFKIPAPLIGLGISLSPKPGKEPACFSDEFKTVDSKIVF
jgi:hypothetical protein